MGKLSGAEKEAYVRTAWQGAHIQWSLIDDFTACYSVVCNGNQPIPSQGFSTIEECWEAAYTFTIAREEKVRQIDEEMAEQALVIGIARADKQERIELVHERTLARLQAIKAELQRGMSAQTKEATDAK